MEHLTNCHGELLWLMTLLSSLPFVGVWLRAKWNKARSAPGHDHEHTE